MRIDSMTLPIPIIKRQAVRNKILACNNCGLGSANRVPFDGPTSDASLVLVGEAPGANEDREGRPFVGRAGKLLDTLLEEVGSGRNATTVINAVCCRPPSNRDPSWDEVQACHSNLLAQLHLTEARVGVTLGRVATSIIKEDPRVTMIETRSTPFVKYGKVWVPTYHPAYALRNPSARSMIEADLRLALSFVAFGRAISVIDSEIGAEIVGS
jgi:uracil-DNA glycosylase family 4